MTNTKKPEECTCGGVHQCTTSDPSLIRRVRKYNTWSLKELRAQTDEEDSRGRERVIKCLVWGDWIALCRLRELQTKQTDNAGVTL